MKPLPQNDFYVYLLFRWNGLPLYVGKGRGDRWNDHTRPTALAKNTKKTNALKQTLSILGEIPRIKLAENLPEKDAHDLERLFVATIGRFPNGPLTNYTDGGDGRANPCQETRDKMSAAKRNMSAETRAKIAFNSRNASAETRAKIGAAGRNRKPSTETREKPRLTSTGRRHTPETIAQR